MATLNLAVSTGNNNSQQHNGAEDSGKNPGAGVVDLNPSPATEPGSHAFDDVWSSAFRFPAAGLPQGATIVDATFYFTSADTYAATPNVVKYYVSADDRDAPSALTATNGDLSGTNRPRTTASGVIDMSIAVTNTEYSVDVTASIQEIANRASWAGTSDLVMLVDTHPDTTNGEWQIFYTYGGDSSKVGRIVINYTTGTPAALAKPVKTVQSVKRAAFF